MLTWARSFVGLLKKIKKRLWFIICKEMMYVEKSDKYHQAYYRQRRKQKKPLEVMDKEEEGSVEKLNLEEVKDLD